jgi:drug/metabolite transporter (DMT)-like permease
VSEAAPDQHANRAGILAMLGAMACFVINDAIVKYASESLPSAQLVFIRSVMAAVLVFGAAVAMGATARLADAAKGWTGARAVIDAISTFLYLIALFHLPLSTATAILMTSPLMLTVLAAVLLKERVRASLWLATAVGFAGVVLIVQPQSADVAYAILCFFATVLICVRDLLTRRVHVAIPSIVLTLSTNVAVSLLAGALSVVEGWKRVGAFNLAILFVAAVFLSVAFYLIVNSLRRTDLSVVAPFRYSALLFAAIVGYVVWGDVPNAFGWAGFALLIGSGVYVVRMSRRARSVPPPID